MQEIHQVCREVGGAAMAMCMSAREDFADQGTCRSIAAPVRHWVGAMEASLLVACRSDESVWGAVRMAWGGQLWCGERVERSPTAYSVRGDTVSGSVRKRRWYLGARRQGHTATW